MGELTHNPSRKVPAAAAEHMTDDELDAYVLSTGLGDGHRYSLPEIQIMGLVTQPVDGLVTLPVDNAKLHHSQLRSMCKAFSMRSALSYFLKQRIVLSLALNRAI